MISLQRGDIDVSSSHTDLLLFFHLFECTMRFARFHRLCLSKSNQIRPEQQRQDQATSEELRLVWSKAKQYRNNLTSLNVSYALRNTFISGSQWTIQRSQDNFRAFHRSSVQLTASQSKPNEIRTSTIYKSSIYLHVTFDFKM